MHLGQDRPGDNWTNMATVGELHYCSTSMITSSLRAQPAK